MLYIYVLAAPLGAYGLADKPAAFREVLQLYWHRNRPHDLHLIWAQSTRLLLPLPWLL